MRRPASLDEIRKAVGAMTAVVDREHEAVPGNTAVRKPARSRLADSVELWKGMALFGAIAIVNTAWWMGAYNYRTLTIDDLLLYITSNTPGGNASTLRGAFTDGSYDKWRPIPNAMAAVITDVFGSNYMSYKLFNLFALTVVCILVAVLALRLTGGRWLLAAGAALAVTVSRFNSYFVLQIPGLMESTALAFALLTAIAFQWAYASKRRSGVVIGNVCFLLATLSHERYLVLLPFVFLATAWAPVGFRSLRERASWAAIPIGVAAFNYGFKAWVIGIDFSTGAGGQELEPDIGQVAEFMRSAFLNTIGYNTGPSYLSGRDAALIGSTAVWLSVALVVPVAIVIVWAIARERRSPSGWHIDVFRPYVLALALFIPLLLSASITFRQEYRWLYAPFCFLVVGVAWAVSRLPTPSARAFLGVAVLAASLSVDGYYRQYVDGTYFFVAQRTTDSVADRIIDQYRPVLGTDSFVLVTGSNDSFERGMLRYGEFFDVYAPGSDIDVRFVETVDEIPDLEGLRPVVHVFEYRRAASAIVSIDGPEA
jgi:hypothetical protein